MFTGLVEEVGSVAQIETSDDGSRIAVSAKKILHGLSVGDSIAVDGACMTVVCFDGNGFTFEVSPESLSRTNFRQFKPGDRVNLERPLTPESRIGGHYVTGHIDGLAEILSIEPQGNSLIYTFRVLSEELAELLVPKGSVAVLGISLTVNTVDNHLFSVAIIPHTLSHTNLADYQPGDPVNIETDLLGKYVRRLLFERQPVSSDDVNTNYNRLEAAITPEISIDAPTLVPAMQPLATASANNSSAGAKIHTGNWFNHTAD